MTARSVGEPKRAGVTSPGATSSGAISSETGQFSELLRGPALIVGASGALWGDDSGHEAALSLRETAARVSQMSPGDPTPLVCHVVAAARRLQVQRFPARDLLELYAFVRPAQFCLPTPGGLATALELDGQNSSPTQNLRAAASALLNELAESAQDARLAKDRQGPWRDLPGIAWAMARAGWAWGPAVLAALGQQHDAGRSSRSAMEAWRRIEEWSEHAPETPPGNVPVLPSEARERLSTLLGAKAEARPGQSDYAAAATAAFVPREVVDQPHFVVAEAGTGVGKTLGYIAPASVWAEKNEGPVWISTYTRNLQSQLDQELDRLHPSLDVKSRRVVIRKGRENYLCLLNFQDAVGAATSQLALTGGGISGDPGIAPMAVGIGLMARWVTHTRDGDMAGGDLPGWLPELIGRGRSVLLADRRGECIYSACEHYHRCFIEKSVRRARRADIVVANHALVMVQAALGGLDDNTIPTRYVFDEGHHLFDAADSAFSGHLTGQETADFRRWLMGAEGRRASRARGLRRRLEDVVAGDDASMSLLDEALRAGRFLPNEGWPNRVMDGKPNGPTEAFLALARNQVLARTRDPESPYGLEVEAGEPIEGLVDAARILTDSLEGISRPLALLADRLETRLDAEAETLETTMRLRMEALTRTIRRRANVQVNGWRQMLKSLGAPAVPGHVDWLAIDRMDGRDIDVGLHRHWIDPTIPFIDFVARPAHGLLVTSATLSDGSGEDESDWEVALDRTGARHLDHPAVLTRSRSPFDYPNATKVLIVNDVRKDQMDQVAAAYRELFLAARGGALGLFTAISRLRAVHRRLAEPLESAGVPLYGQHVDAMDLPTLIEIFRAEEDSCLLGTDAARDGMDVPGNALRLIVFDRVPWPRPDILHRARRTAFGGRHYDDQITRLRLKQAFGRLVRKSDDRGVFVLLDPMMPTRLTTAFPEGVSVERVGLAEAVVATRSFLTHSD